MDENRFLTHLKEHAFQGQDPFRSYREKSWHRLCDLGLPTKSHETFRYVSLKELYQASFEPSLPKPIDKSHFAHVILPECQHSHLVFIDGRFSSDLSDISALPSQTVILPLDEALRTHASFLQFHLSRFLKEEKDVFALTNLSLHRNGVFFYLPPQCKVQSPLQTLYLFTDRSSAINAPRLHLVIGSQSHLDWIASSYSSQSTISHFFLPSAEIFLEEGSNLNLFNAIDCPTSSWQLESIRAVLKRNARFYSSSFTSGARTWRQSYHVQLQGENSEAHLNGLWMLNQNHTSHIHATLEHHAPHTRSQQLFKGVLRDISQSSFEGKILVRPEAQKTEAYQLNKNLILNSGAIANSKPNLEVFADDVKASHGATVSQLDPQQLFYLSTRGIDPNHARHLLIQGFCREMIEQIPYDSLRQKILRQMG